MRCAVFIIISSVILTTQHVFASYESGPGYGVSHSSYGAGGASVAHSPPPGGWGSGHAGGSYYHYHVPLVGQQSHGHYPPQHQPQSHDHHLYYILPLLLLAALPLLLLPLLPLLLLPLGLSLLALLLPLLMMGGMMMMMMMMDGGMMMMMRNRNPGSYNAGDARNFGSLILTDLTELMGRYARSLDLDHCAERISCEAGSFIFPYNSGDSNSTAQTARSWMDFIVEQAAPKGKARRVLRHYKRAFWMGASSNGKNCREFKCQPVFRLEETNSVPSHHEAAGGAGVFDNSTLSRSYEDYYKMYAAAKPFSPSNYYVQQSFVNNSSSTQAPVRRTVFTVKPTQ